MQPPRRRWPATLGRPALACALLVCGYYLVPVNPDASAGRFVARALATLGLGVLVTWLIVRQMKRLLADPVRAPLAGLAVALVCGVFFFALADYVVAVSDPGQFADLRTRTDALYFALATLATVGYGDVHAQGQLARALVSLQMAFNVLVIATGATVLTRQLGDRLRDRHRSGR